MIRQCVRASPPWRPSGVAQGLQTPPGTIVPAGPQESLESHKASRHLQAPQIVFAGPQESRRASRHLQAPQIVPAGPQEALRSPGPFRGERSLSQARIVTDDAQALGRLWVQGATADHSLSAFGWVI